MLAALATLTRDCVAESSELASIQKMPQKLAADQPAGKNLDRFISLPMPVLLCKFAAELSLAGAA